MKGADFGRLLRSLLGMVTKNQQRDRASQAASRFPHPRRPLGRATAGIVSAVALAASATVLTGCSSIFSSDSSDFGPPEFRLTAQTARGAGIISGDSSPSEGWLTDGVVAISRPAPAPSTVLALGAPGGATRREGGANTSSTDAAGQMLDSGALDSGALLGFMPLPPSQAALWLSIDTRAGTIALMRGSTEIVGMQGQGAQELKAGTYTVVHKQSDPRWYAPDSYFTRRGLPVPPEGDRARLRRGALGEHAIFLDKDTPLHTGPIWSAEVGGVKVESGAFGHIYEQLDVGSKVEIK